MENKQILKNLNAVLYYSKEHFNNEFVNQEVILDDDFKAVFQDYMETRGKNIEYFQHTSVLTNREGQHIYIANQWFAIASYFVDFCTELLTYQQYFEKVCDAIGVCSSKNKKDYATRLKNVPDIGDEDRFCVAALRIFKEDFPDADNYEKVAGYLWRFVSDYNWWAGNKTVDRHDFYISPILNQLNVVNANAEFLAEIVLSYSSDLKLRRMVERLDNFTVGIRKNNYLPTGKEIESYKEAENITIPQQPSNYMSISISAASFERFKSENR